MTDEQKFLRKIVRCIYFPWLAIINYLKQKNRSCLTSCLSSIGYKNNSVNGTFSQRGIFTSDVYYLTWHIFKRATREAGTFVSLNLTDDFIRHRVRQFVRTSEDNTVICNSLASYATVLIVAARDKWRAAIPSSTIYASTTRARSPIARYA